MRLWYSPSSPFVRKVLILAYEIGIVDQLERINVASTAVAPDLKLMQENPLGKIPTLVLEDGRSLFDSRVICEYLDGLHDGETMFPAAGMERMNALVTQSLGDGIMEAAVAIRYEFALRPKEKQWSNWKDAQFLKINHALDVLETWRDARIQHIHIGSITVASALAYLDFRFSEYEWRKDRPVLSQMLATFSERRSMIETVAQG